MVKNGQVGRQTDLKAYIGKYQILGQKMPKNGLFLVIFGVFLGVFPGGPGRWGDGGSGPIPKTPKTQESSSLRGVGLGFPKNTLPTIIVKFTLITLFDSTCGCRGATTPLHPLMWYAEPPVRLWGGKRDQGSLDYTLRVYICLYALIKALIKA